MISKPLSSRSVLPNENAALLKVQSGTPPTALSCSPNECDGKDRHRRRSVMKEHFTHTQKIMAP